MYSLTINPDRSAVYTEMTAGVQTTTVIPSDDFMAIMLQAPSGPTRWEDIDAAIDAYLAARG